MAVARVDAIRSKAYGSITNSYTTLGAATSKNWRLFRIINNTDGDMLISFDGTTDNIFLAAGSFVLYDLSTNSPPISQVDNLVLGLTTQFYIKYSSAPTNGTVYLEGIYAFGSV